MSSKKSTTKNQTQTKVLSRKFLTSFHEAMELPDLVEVQKTSYDWFVGQGLKELFEEISPIKDIGGRDLELSFTDYYLDEPKFDENTSKEKNITYESPLRVKAVLANKKDKTKKEQEIYLGDFPLMTDRGTFIINGIERAVVSQIIRSSGVFFTSNYIRGKKYYGAKVIPNRGAWLEIETDTNNILWVKIDRKRKVAVTSLLRAFGIPKEFKQDESKHIGDLREEREKKKRKIRDEYKEGIGPKIYAVLKNEGEDLLNVLKDKIEEISKDEWFPKGYLKSNFSKLAKIYAVGANKDKDFGILWHNFDIFNAKKKWNERNISNESKKEIEEYLKENLNNTHIEKVNKEFEEKFDAFRTKIKDKLEIDELLEATWESSINKFIDDSKKIVDKSIFDRITFLNYYQEDLESVSKKIIDRITEITKKRDNEIEQINREYEKKGVTDKSNTDKSNLDENERLINIFKDTDNGPGTKYIANTLKKDIAQNEDEGLIEVYKRIRPGDLATPDNAKSLIHSMFFRFERYDFGKVGRYKINQRFKYDIPNTPETRILRREDLIDVIKEIIRLNITQEDADDIDHLSNRRIRAVGELIQNKFRIGLARMERIVRDKMSTVDIETMTPGRLINAKPVMGVVKEFFMSSQLSQFMDQTNPLAELEHKRRISAMGPGGLSRERAGFEVRDVHTTHYGRICPIETPEGPNIGLVGHLASYAKINEYGFIETPYRIVQRIALQNVKDPVTKKTIKKGQKLSKDIIDNLRANKISYKAKAKVSDEIIYLNALEEERSITTAATTSIDDKGNFLKEKAEVRKFGKPDTSDVDQIDYMDVASNQIVSISTSCIPFLEHDDAVRALMGSNMQRQAVPCINPVAPFVGTGVESKAAFYSGHEVISQASGKIFAVDGAKIEVLEDSGNLRHYDLNKFRRSNASTCINQHPTAVKGQKVKKGEVLSDGPSISEGELALGQNVLVAFMSWGGYNYEDAIILSEKVVQKDLFTSIHIENYKVEVRETKLGPEVITSDIPNIGEEKLKNLDEKGIIRIGAEVSSGDILVGKITPKGETELSAEEKLLRAIFGEKARDVRDSSLYLEHGDHGKVIDIKVFSQEKGDKLSPGVIEMIQVSVADLRKIQVGDKIAGRHGNKGIISRVVPVADMPFLEDGTPIDVILSPLGVVSRMNLGQILETHLGFAVQKLGYKIATPVLYGVSEKEIKALLKEAGFPENGKITLFDGKTGESFDKQVTIGYKYMLKLNHMVEDKIHQRSIGPYSLITQQPLGGKAQFGGQRFGEMEVWALEAYGAAHTLQEVLTIKSDDVPGRSKAYESIIKGEPIKKLNIPESFNVLVRELKGLGLDIELLRDGKPVSSDTSSKPNKKFVK